jgi:hypothetical protein
MALKNWTIIDVGGTRNVRQVRWDAGASGDTFQPFTLDDGETVVEISLTASASDFGSASLSLNGANDAVVTVAAQDMLGDDIAIAAASRKEARVRDRYRILTPVLTGLGGVAVVPVLTYWVRQ